MSYVKYTIIIVDSNIWGCVLAMKVEFHGLDGNGGVWYIGTGCFHQRDALSGNRYERHYKTNWNKEKESGRKDGAHKLEEACKVLASCTYEENTLWGKEVVS